MAKRLPADVYADLLAAGFPPDQATVMTAIAGAESGYDDTALGDVQLQDATWGPSFGEFQIRTLKAATGTGSPRDISALAGDDQAQAAAAYQISQGGRDFTPWSVFTSGAYQAFLPAAQQAATTQATAGGDKPWPTWGPQWLPWNWPSDAANAAAGAALGGARSIAVEAVFIIAGLGLVVAGLVVVGRPASARARGAVQSTQAKVGRVIGL